MQNVACERSISIDVAMLSILDIGNGGEGENDVNGLSVETQMGNGLKCGFLL
jgi:hypothetical protein